MMSTVEGESGKDRKDIACWQCHLECIDFSCSICQRSFHNVCLDVSESSSSDWICSVCERVSDAECVDTPTNLGGSITIDGLALMLRHAVNLVRPRVSELFRFPVNIDLFPKYPDFVVHPMDLSTLDMNVQNLQYSSTAAFLADAEWIYHNSCVFNSVQAGISKMAKRTVSLIKQQVDIIELCPDCYSNSLVANGFSKLCTDPHEPVWAKVQGFPYWPAKVMREKAHQVDLHFFGAHDQAWVSKSKVLRMSKKVPERVSNNRRAFECAMEELRAYVENLQMATNFQFSELRAPFTGTNKIARSSQSPVKRRLSVLDGDYLAEEKYSEDDKKFAKQISVPLARVKTEPGEEPLAARSLSFDAHQVSDERSDSEGPNLRPRSKQQHRSVFDVFSEVEDQEEEEDGVSDIAGHGESTEDDILDDLGDLVASDDDTAPIHIPRHSSEEINNIIDAVQIKFCGEVVRPQVTSSQLPSSSSSSVSGANLPRSTSRASSHSDGEFMHTFELSRKMQENLGPVSPLDRPQMSSSSGTDSRKRPGGNTPESAPAPSRPRMEVKGTPNFEAAQKGCITESKIVDKVTEKLSGSLESIVQNYLSGIQPAIPKPVSQHSDAQQEEQIKNLKLEVAQLKTEKQALTSELEKIKTSRNKEVLDVSNSYEYLMAEVQSQMLAACRTEVNKIKNKVNLIKRKQWCAVCLKEAFYMCCWNTSYCGQDCQRTHWPEHASHCTQIAQQQSSRTTQNRQNRPVNMSRIATNPGIGCVKSVSSLANPGR